MQRPNYHLLLQSILNKSLQSSPDRRDSIEDASTSQNKDITEFLQENLLWQETIPPQKAKRYKLPKTLPSVLRKALKVNSINSLYSHQARCLQ
ncbi:MAG: DEAD/DEAH box helicase, partial [Cyanobacteria bacterium J06629_2]